MSERRPAPKSGSEDSLIPASTIAKAASLEELVVAIGGAIQQSEAGDEAPLRLNVAEPWIKRRSLASASRSDSNVEGSAEEDATTPADESGIWAGVPPVPTTIEATGLPEAFLRELVLKVIWANDRPTLTTVCNVTGLNMRVIEDVMRGLDREGLCHTDAAPNQSNLQFHYRLTDKGKNAAHDALSRSRYIGVAPVTVNAYREMITRQLALFRRPPFEEIRRALEHLVLPPRLVRMIAQAFFSRRTLMVYGPSGNGKTEIVTSIARTAVGRVIIPYAIYGQGQLIRVFDPEFHKPQIDADNAASEGPWAPAALRHDRRWLPIDRPVVVVGGDMGGDALEMTYDPTLGIHHAPLSVVAQGGVLVIDDLGRQRVSAKEILNRWVLMMEQGADTFSLSTSEVVRLPLDVTLIFSTNLTIQELVDEAYMRRIAYKIAIPNPSADELAEITRRFCTRREIDWTEPAIQHLVGRLFASGQEPRGCYPRDIITTIIDEAEFEDREPVFDEASIDMATALYLGIELDED